jgi:hypothetical protein
MGFEYFKYDNKNLNFFGAGKKLEVFPAPKYNIYIIYNIYKYINI